MLVCTGTRLRGYSCVLWLVCSPVALNVWDTGLHKPTLPAQILGPAERDPSGLCTGLTVTGLYKHVAESTSNSVQLDPNTFGCVWVCGCVGGCGCWVGVGWVWVWVLGGCGCGCWVCACGCWVCGCGCV